MKFFVMVLAGMLFASTAQADSLDAPYNQCNANWESMVEEMVAVGAAYGQVPTEDDLRQMREINPCDCVYDKIRTDVLPKVDADDLASDLYKIELWMKTVYSRQMRGKHIPDKERWTLIQTLTYGEPLADQRGVAQMACMME